MLELKTTYLKNFSERSEDLISERFLDYSFNVYSSSNRETPCLQLVNFHGAYFLISCPRHLGFF